MDVSLKTLLLAFAVTLRPNVIRCPRVKWVVETIDMRNCSVGPTVSNYFHNMNIVNVRRDSNYVTGEFIVGEPATNLKWKGLIYKCSRRDALIEQEGCEFLIKVERNDMCADIKMKNVIWSSFFNSSEPPFVCPFNKGVYKFSRIFFDVEHVLAFFSGVPLVQDYYWVLRAFGYKGRKAWSCMEYVVKIGTVKA